MIRALLCVVLILFAGYGVVEALPIITGPAISLASPADHSVSPDGIVSISGRAERAAALTLNGSPLLREEDGSFSTILTLPRGGSPLTLVATDRFGTSVTATRNVFVP